MTRLLHIEASPRDDRSKSSQVARELITAYLEKNPDHIAESWEIWTDSLPTIDGDTLAARYKIMHGQELNTIESGVWAPVVSTFERFASADKYVLSTPMWNFGIPYRLKWFIDAITHPGMAFKYNPQTGYQGLIVNKPIVVIYARGGDYSGERQSYDLQAPYIEQWLRFIGFETIQTLYVQPTLAAGPEAAQAAISDALTQARELATAF